MLIIKKKHLQIFFTLLNNFGVVSYEYGVIKKYNVKIKFNFSNYKIK